MTSSIQSRAETNDTVSSNTPPAVSPITDIDLSKIELPVDVSNLVGNELLINEALPGLVKGEGTALLLDVNNLFRVAQENDFRIDYVKLQSILAHRCDLRHCAAFSAVVPNDVGSMNWVSFMKNSGYIMVTKDLNRYINEKGQSISKGNLDIELTIAAMKLDAGFGHIVIGTCDSDFIPLLDELRSGYFRKVSVLGIGNQNSSGMSEALARKADHFYDLNKIKDFVSFKGNKNDRQDNG